jgi:probable phosphoglycerate mutase
MTEMSRRTALMSIGGAALAGTLAIGTAASASAATVPTAQPNRTVTVYLARHGQTWLNRTGRIQGWSDSPLTDAGVKIAATVGRNLAAEVGGFDAAYSADMIRHFQTATGMLAGAGSSLVPTRLAGLREVSYGGWEGETQNRAYPVLLGAAKSMALTDIIDAFGATNPDKSLPTETWAGVAARMNDALTAAATDRTMPMKHGGSILAVSSGMSISCLLESLGATIPAEGLANGAVNKLTYAQGAWTVVSVNDTSYAS